MGNPKPASRDGEPSGKTVEPAPLRTNLLRVDVDDLTIEVGTLAPYSLETHRTLERTVGADGVVRRRGDVLEVVRTNSRAAALDMPIEKRSTRRLGKLLNILIERGIERRFLELGLRVVHRRPLKVVSLASKNDLAHKLFAQRGGQHLPLHVRRGFRLESKLVFGKVGPRLALVVDAITHADLDGTCEDLIADGFDIGGLYVHDIDVVRGQGGGAPLLGQVDRVEGSIVHLGADRRGTRSEYNAASLMLDLGPAALARLSSYYVGPNAHEALWDERNSLATGGQRWARIAGFADRLSRDAIEIAPGVNARIAGWINAHDLGLSTAPLPQYVVGGGERADSTIGVFRGGPRHVPAHLRTGPIRACVICERSRRREVDAFLNAFANGAGSHRPLRQTWRLGDLTFTCFEATGGTANAYEKACRQAIDDGTAWQLALVQVPSDMSNALGDASPYLITKAKLLARGVPVQEFRVETMQKPLSQLQWALGGMGLQVFAKLGGVPWLLKTRTRVHELVLGLGSANLGSGRLGARERVVGLTTAFSGDGTYWLTETSRTAQFDEHEEAVIESAVAAFKKVREEMAWRTGDPVRVVMYSFKDFKDRHVDALRRAVMTIAGEYTSVEFAFVHIVEHHPALLFDPGERAQIPQRGAVVRLGAFEALVTVFGPSEVRNSRTGFPRPILLKVHRSSTFTDISYLSWQALAFSSSSWRNFLPTTAPAPVQYAKWIADLIGRLGTLSRWDPDVIRGGASTSMWFL